MKLIILIPIIFLIACNSAPPDAKDFNIDACYQFARCMYDNQKNEDKSICVPLSSECRAFQRFEYCKNPENLPERMDFDKCWLLLNQK
jgi:hypothetical protein